VVSEPVTPVYVEGLPYLQVDMGRDGRGFPERRVALTRLYGNDIKLDWRSLTTFGRDVSLISDADYQSWQPPTHVSSFPRDLEDDQLEYSGIYEDGWISERSYFILSSAQSSQFLTVRGMVPNVGDPGFSTNLAVSIDGAQVAKKALGLGAFEITVPVAASAGRHRIDLAFDGAQRLPGNDGRPFSAKIDFLGYAAAPVEGYPSAFRPGSNVGAGAASDGIWPDGWASTRAELTLAGGSSGQLAVRGMVPDLGWAFATKLHVNIDGSSVGSVDVRPGELSVALPIPASEGARRVGLEFDDGQDFTAPTRRRISMLVRQISIEPVPTEFVPGSGAEATAGAEGIWSDGWTSTQAELTLAGGAEGRIAVRGMVPDLGRVFATKLPLILT
jgi:hypothetical protein